MKKFIALIIILCLSAVAVAQDNYKLGDFGDSQIKAKSVNIGGSWTVKKSSTTKGLEFWYGNASKATLSTAGVLTVTSMPSLAVTGVITGGSLSRGSAAFTQGQTVVKIPLVGCTTIDYVFIQITGSDSTTTVSPNSLCRAYPKTDTIVVIRAAGTTSGLTFDWFRIK